MQRRCLALQPLGMSPFIHEGWGPGCPPLTPLPAGGRGQAAGLPPCKWGRGGKGLHQGKEEPLAGALTLCPFPTAMRPIRILSFANKKEILCFRIHCEFVFPLRSFSFTNIMLYFSIKLSNVYRQNSRHHPLPELGINLIGFFWRKPT